MRRNLRTFLAPPVSKTDRRRRKREFLLMLGIIAVLALLTIAENQIISFGPRFSVSSTILMFIIININLLLLLLLIFLVFRNLAKLLYERRRNVLGSRLRTRLVSAFITLTLAPAGVLFFFSLNFITNSIEFWFTIPIEQALENALNVGQRFYERVNEQHLFFLQRIACEVDSRRLLSPGKEAELARYLTSAQREFNLRGLEIYTPSGDRLTTCFGPELQDMAIAPISVRNLTGSAGAPPAPSPGRPDVRTMAHMTERGELNRFIVPIPFQENAGEVRGYVAAIALLPPELTENLLSVSRGVEEYDQIKLLKNPIRATYYMVLSIVALVVVFCAVWFGFIIARSISIPIKQLAEGTRRVAEGDLEFSIAITSDDEIGSLVVSFNQMTRELRANRRQLELSARILKEQNAEIESRRRYMEIVLRNVSTGVVALDAGGFINAVNKSAERMTGIRAADVQRRNFRRLLSGDRLALAEELENRLARAPEHGVEVPVRLTLGGRPRSFYVHAASLRDDANRPLGVVVVFDDLTDREKAQRMAAWREVARRIAHEVKNPLTPISLSAQRLRRKYAGRINEPVFEECIRMIIEHTETIRNLVNEFSKFARFPAARPRPCALSPILDEAIALYREGFPHVVFEVLIHQEPPELNLDPRQLKQALSNLVDNAIAAMKQEGTIQIEVSLAETATSRRVRIDIADSGPGISDEDKARLFEPYFSTKTTGMGLGLTIVNTIIAEHKGGIRVTDNAGGGTRFIIDLPV